MDNLTSGMGAYGCMNFPIVHINMVTSGLMKQGGVSYHYGPVICIKKLILRQKKSYGNSNTSPCKNIIFDQILEKETKILQGSIITL
jgi:hypothetical protein